MREDNNGGDSTYKEEDLRRKTHFEGRQTLLEDNVLGKITFERKHPWMEKMTFGEGQPLREGIL